MRILHTSDWHLGHSLYNYDRTQEQQYMLLQMINIVREQKPDAFIISGDIYHTPQPSAAVQTMLTNALVDIHNANPEMTIVVTAGNHDSCSKHDIFKTPWKAMNVYTIGSVDIKHPEDLIVEIPGKGFIIAVPYVNERKLNEGFFQQLIDCVEKENGKGQPVIMMAHTTVGGADFTGHDNSNDYTVGGIDSYSIEDMGRGYDYLALGHIHHAQFIHGSNHRARYSGTPLAVSFDERFKHSVSIVDIDKHGDIPTVEEIEIDTHRPLVTLPTEGFASWEDAKALLKDYPDDIEAYIRLNVEVDDFLPTEANAEALLLTEEKKCRFCTINAQRVKKQGLTAKGMSIQEFKTEAPIDIARRYAEDTGICFDDEMAEMFKDTLNMIEEDERNA